MIGKQGNTKSQRPKRNSNVYNFIITPKFEDLGKPKPWSRDTLSKQKPTPIIFGDYADQII